MPEYSSEERSPFESNLFQFKRKEANRVASLCFLSGLGVGFLIGLIVVLFFGGRWYRSISFGTVIGGLVGFAIGFAVGTKMDVKKRRKKKKQLPPDEE